MKNNQRKSDRSLLVFFTLSILFALTSIPASKLVQFPPELPPQHEFAWVFWLFVALSLVSLLPVLYALLVLLHQKKWLPGLMDILFREKLETTDGKEEGRIRQWVRSLGARVIIAGGLVLVFIGILSWLKVGESREFSARLYQATSQATGIGHLQTLLSPHGRSTKEASPYVANLFFRTNDNNNEEYFRNCVFIVDRLKRAGAKAVLVKALNSFPEGNPDKYLREIDSLDIAVFALPQTSTYYLETITSMKFWANTVMTLPENEAGSVRTLYRIKPFAGEAHGYFVPPYSPMVSEGEPEAKDYPIEDVSLQLIGKYRGYSKDIVPRREGSNVVFGDLRIPVTDQGWFYAYKMLPADSWFSMYVQRIGNSDSLSYTVIDPRTRMERPMTNQDLVSAYKGKIVLLDWYNDGDRFNRNYALFIYGGVLDQILGGNTLRIVEYGPFWFTLFAVLACCLIGYFTRGLLSVLLTVLLGVCLVIFGTFLAGQASLIDLSYPLFAVILSLFILPSVVVVGESSAAHV